MSDYSSANRTMTQRCISTGNNRVRWILRLPPSLQPFSDRIGKIFDMVKFIENDWTRDGEGKCAYMSLATIHEAQIKSNASNMRGPTMGMHPPCIWSSK